MESTPTPVPDEVRRALRGWPQVGIWDQMFALLTVDAEGFPHVCLLSRAELEAGVSEIRAVIASPTTSANLKRSRRATLMVIDPAAAWYCKLEVLGLRVRDGEPLGAKFQVASVKRDSVDVALKPARFLPTAALTRAEDWRRSERLLAALDEAAS
ncbi:MAG: hypothetical protein JOY89_15175 [Solirubrobacterales bacterium]|nr:hypothetical protein [Solirubrobacterales bacterium]